MAKRVVFYIVRTTFVLLFYCAVFMGLAYAAVSSYEFGFQIFSNPIYNSADQSTCSVRVADGQDELSLMKKLEDEGVISDYKVAYTRLQLSEYKGKLKKGSYAVKASMPLDDILATLTGQEQPIGEQ